MAHAVKRLTNVCVTSFYMEGLAVSTNNAGHFHTRIRGIADHTRLLPSIECKGSVSLASFVNIGALFFLIWLV